MSTITKERFEQLQREVKSASQAAERAAGALEEATRTLKEKFKCNSLKEAKSKLAKLTRTATQAEEAFEQAFTEYETKWHEED